MTHHVPVLPRILRPASFAPLALVLGALAACDDATTDPLARIVAGETAGALADFEKRYADNPLVMDKWMSIQAMAPGETSCDRVVELMDSPHYNAGNPNRVRALVGAFSAGNPTGFNRADGAGYQLLARVVTQTDARNPQLAARLLTAMRSWRSLETGRQEEARKALVSIRNAEKLSTDVSDIVERTLQ